jgi:hypothetical protein
VFKDSDGLLKKKRFPDQGAVMSFTTSVILIAVFDVLIIAALAAVCLVPFRIERPRRVATQVRRIGSTDLLDAEENAA